MTRTQPRPLRDVAGVTPAVATSAARVTVRSRTTRTLLAFGAALTVACGAPDPTPSASSNAAAARTTGANAGLTVQARFPAARSASALDGRLLLLVSTDSTREPRFQISDGATTQLVFGTDVDGWSPDTDVTVDGAADRYPLASLADVPPGRYWVQAVLNRYETFTRSDGHTVKLPPDKGKGSNGTASPGICTARRSGSRSMRAVHVAHGSCSTRRSNRSRRPGYALDQARHHSQRAPLEVLGARHVDRRERAAPRRIRRASRCALSARGVSRALSGHLHRVSRNATRSQPRTRLSARFNLRGYNRIQQELAHQFYKDWTGPDFPRVLLIEIRHPTPYYDDSYAVNSANQGPYGDAIMYELIPEVEKRFRGLGQGWARITYGGSTGGWEAMAVQVFYPDEFNGAFAACPDPIDFRAYTVLNLYEDDQRVLPHEPVEAHAASGEPQLPRPREHHAGADESARNGARLQGTLGGSVGYLAGHLLTGGTRRLSPADLGQEATGVIDKEVAAYWRENYDLSYILRARLGHARPQAARQDQHLRGRHGQLLPQQRRLSHRGAARSLSNPKWTGESPTVIAPSTAGMAIPRAATRTRGCAITRCTSRAFSIACARGRPAGADTLSWRY
jgi:hypothetical protein